MFCHCCQAALPILPDFHLPRHNWTDSAIYPGIGILNLGLGQAAPHCTLASVIWTKCRNSVSQQNLGTLDFGQNIRNQQNAAEILPKGRNCFPNLRRNFCSCPNICFRSFSTSEVTCATITAEKGRLCSYLLRARASGALWIGRGRLS